MQQDAYHYLEYVELYLLIRILKFIQKVESHIRKLTLKEMQMYI